MYLPQINLKLWLYLILSSTSFGFVLTAGGAIFNLFGTPLAWLFLPLTTFLLGVGVAILYPPPIMAILAELLDSLDILIQYHTQLSHSPVQSADYSHPIGKGEANYSGMPIVVYSPSFRRNWTGYLVIIRTGDQAPTYLKDWDKATGTVEYTNEPTEAFCFAKQKDAFRLAHIVYVLEDCGQRVEMVGIEKAGALI